LFIKGTQKEFKLMSDDLTREIKVNGDKYERIDVASIHLLYQRKEKNILATIEAGLKQAEENTDIVFYL
jgi:hypothetical protein